MSEQRRSTESDPTVLILEDEEGLAALYETWLSAEYSIRTTYTASQARDAFDEAVDIALIDRRLPQASGDEILHWIRKKNPNCRTAMVTAVSPDFDIIDMPLDEYLVKPIGKDELVGAVEKLHDLRTYGDTVRRLSALVTKKARLADEKSRIELETSEAYEKLQRDIEVAYGEAEETLPQPLKEDTVNSASRKFERR